MTNAVLERQQTDRDQRKVAESFQKLPPQDLRAERGVLGSILIFGEIIHDVMGIVAPKMFYLASHGQIFAGMLELSKRKIPIDAVTLSSELERRGELAEIGGDDYLIQLLNSVPHAGHARFYAEEIRDRFIQRGLIYACTEIAATAYDGHTPSAELLQKASNEIQSLSELQVKQSGGLPGAMLAVLDRIEAGRPAGLTTGFVDLDRLIGGLKPGTEIILGARPATGKTSFAANLAWNVSKHSPVLFISLEQTTEELGERWLASLLGTSVLSLPDFARDDASSQRLTDAANEVGSRSIIVDDRSGQSVADIGALCRINQRKQKIGLIVCDYLQLIRPDDRKAPREIQVSGISRALKELAKSIGVPVLALAQLNRGIELREDKRPRLSDLRESGGIEADADLVLFLDRKSTWDNSANSSEASLIIAKHRNGQCGEVPLYWDAESMTFHNAARGSFDGLELPDVGF